MTMPEGLSEGGKRLFTELEKAGKRARAAIKKERGAKAADLTRARILEALAAAGTITEAAEMAGVSRKTVYAYMNADAEFITAYRDMKRGQVRDIAETVTKGAGKAATYIAKLLDDKEAPASVKLSAAVKLLEIGAKYRETETAIDGATLKSLEPFAMRETSPL